MAAPAGRARRFIATTACAQAEKTDFTKDVQATPHQASRWVCKAYYTASTPGYEKPALFLYADRVGASQCAMRQLPDNTAAKLWMVTGDLRMARLSQTRHGYRMWMAVKSGNRELCRIELNDRFPLGKRGQYAGAEIRELSMSLVEDQGVYTGGANRKNRCLRSGVHPLLSVSRRGKISFCNFGGKVAFVPVTEWQHPTALEFGCHTATDAVEFGIGNLQFMSE